MVGNNATRQNRVDDLIAENKRLRQENEKLRELVHKHHDVGLTGHVEDWGRDCKVCKAVEVDT